MQRSGQGVTYRDPVAKVPYFVNPNTKLWVGFDDEASLSAKVNEPDLSDKHILSLKSMWWIMQRNTDETRCSNLKYEIFCMECFEEHFFLNSFDGHP